MSNDIDINRAPLHSLAEQASRAMQRGDAVSALRLARSVLEKTSGNIAMFALAANAALRLRDWKVAIDVGEQWLKIHAGDPRAIHALAHAYFELGEFAKSRDVYRSLIERASRFCGISQHIFAGLPCGVRL